MPLIVTVTLYTEQGHKLAFCEKRLEIGQSPISKCQFMTVGGIAELCFPAGCADGHHSGDTLPAYPPS
jgi:hypothetical protein